MVCKELSSMGYGMEGRTIMDFSWDSIQPTENLILVPTAPLASLVQSQLLAKQPNHALRGSVVLDFDRFIEQLLAKADRSAPRLQDRERELLLLEVVRQLDQQGELQYFSYRPDHPGLMSLLSQAIGMLKLSGILPAILERAVAGLPAKDRDLASIYRRYQATISALGYQDMEDRFLVAAELLASQPERHLSGLRAVYGLYLHDLHPMQEKILDLLQLHMPDSRIDRRVARSHSPHAALRELTEHWSEQSQGPGLLSAIEGVTILQAPDPRREVAWMVKEVKRRMLSQGLKPWQVALVVREADRYGGYLVRELEHAGIPYHFSSKEPLLPHPVARRCCFGSRPPWRLRTVLTCCHFCAWIYFKANPA
jgi:ATP-dependent helicase/DNAse subunit B